ncbi:hypothetical protein [Microbulbifer rhizosphaerae]|uniref:Acyl-CoA oxidase n=1 Tax=Microbulbifer rhizosphaerae TaxID=1562603 RepID=A0A7W4ZA19_9GAMM|nr:hypothetical protein [Microbulbifer rhizosphaerae]MBB3062277.1 acyl-CoA oxidase [Microbulbifer rhizosphaerae]
MLIKRDAKVQASADAPYLGADLARILLNKDRQPELACTEAWTKALLREPSFGQDESLGPQARFERTYRWLDIIRERINEELAIGPDEIVRDPRRLVCVTGLLSILDGAAWAVANIHYLLALRTVLEAADRSPAVKAVADEMLKGRTVGCFVLGELSTGTNAIAIETEARYEPQTREFVLNTPTAGSLKWMPNSWFQRERKVAVLFARLVTKGEDEGVFPFLVPLDSPGVEARWIGVEPTVNLDNSCTWLRDVRIPKDYLLVDSEIELTDEGEFRCTEPSRRRRLLRSIDRLSFARLSGSLTCITAAQAVVFLAVNGAREKRVFSPGSPGVSARDCSNFYLPLVDAVATMYALRLRYNSIVNGCSPKPSEEREQFMAREASILKAFVSLSTFEVIGICRQRTGSHGMFGANRILENLIGNHAIFTAEGESDVLLLKVGSDLVRGIDYKPPARARPGARSRLLSWLCRRELAVRRSLRVRMFLAQRRRPLTEVWKENTDELMRLGRIHAERLVAESLESAAREAQAKGGEAGGILHLLSQIYTSGLVLRDGAWFGGRPWASRRVLRGLARARLASAQALAPRLDELVEAFEIDNAIMRAPIGESKPLSELSKLLDGGIPKGHSVMQSYHESRHWGMRRCPATETGSEAVSVTPEGD